MYEADVDSRSNSQNLMSLSALPDTSASPSRRTCKDQTVDECALMVSIKLDEAKSKSRISPDLVPIAIYETESAISQDMTD